jgi:hypothetical protein
MRFKPLKNTTRLCFRFDDCHEYNVSITTLDRTIGSAHHLRAAHAALRALEAVRRVSYEIGDRLDDKVKDDTEVWSPKVEGCWDGENVSVEILPKRKR